MTKKGGCIEACHHTANIHIDTKVIQAGISTVHTQQCQNSQNSYMCTSVVQDKY